jgi:hypothetical protein
MNDIAHLSEEDFDQSLQMLESPNVHCVMRYLDNYLSRCLKSGSDHLGEFKHRLGYLFVSKGNFLSNCCCKVGYFTEY